MYHTVISGYRILFGKYEIGILAREVVEVIFIPASQGTCGLGRGVVWRGSDSQQFLIGFSL
jgi:hypothetical protein